MNNAIALLLMLILATLLGGIYGFAIGLGLAILIDIFLSIEGFIKNTTCRYCGEQVLRKAKVCKHCHSELKKTK